MATAVVAVVALVLGAIALWPSGDHDQALSSPRRLPSEPEGSTLIATPTRDIDAYGEPGGDSTGTIAATWHDRVSSLPVIDERQDWLRVRLPERPNGSTAWVRREDVQVTATPYRIEVDVATTRLRLYDRDEMVLDAPAGVGRDATPTTVGNFFVAFFQEAPSEEWGPFVIVTSGHSETISDWEEFGDAIIAIHGPLDSGDRIGETGTKISAGCVRLHTDALAALRDVPAGSPVDIVDSSAA